MFLWSEAAALFTLIKLQELNYATWSGDALTWLRLYNCFNELTAALVVRNLTLYGCVCVLTSEVS